jgi:hypothetical protein
MHLKKTPGIEEAPLQGELMLFDPVSSKFFVLNSTMAFLWRHCDGDRSLDDVVTAMTDAFSGVDPETAKADLSAAVEELRDGGLISW